MRKAAASASALALFALTAAFAGPAAAQSKLPPRPVPAAVAPLSAEDQALVDRAVAYLEALSSAAGRFVQTDARGAVTQGDIAMQRPGKARFEYDPPSGLLVVAGNGLVSVFDRRLKTFDSYPIRATPLGLFLAGRIKLDGGVKGDNIRAIAAAGADTFVAGSAIFNSPDYAATIARMRAEISASTGAG